MNDRFLTDHERTEYVTEMCRNGVEFVTPLFALVGSIERKVAARACSAVAEALSKLEAVLCDPEGRASISGSAGDRREIDEALAALRSCVTDQKHS